jgi:hypothetical protein
MRGVRIKDFIPIRRHLQTFVNREDAVPVEFGMGLVAVYQDKIGNQSGVKSTKEQN